MNEQLLERLKKYETAVFALGHAMGILYYDGNTVAPQKSAIVRGESLGELSRMAYEITTGPEAVKLLEDLEAAKDTLDPVTNRKAELMRREFDETSCIPVDEYVEYVKLQNSPTSRRCSTTRKSLRSTRIRMAIPTPQCSTPSKKG